MSQSNIICYIGTPIDAADLRRLLDSMDGYILDVDDAENLVIRREAT